MDKRTLLGFVSEYFKERPRQAVDEYKVTDWSVIDQDFIAVISVALDRWLTEGRQAKDFRTEIAKAIGVRYAILTNSGSSANLLAMTVAKDYWMCSNGDKVISCTTAFPTTVAPILQCGLMPYFIDIDEKTLTFNMDNFREAICRKDVVGAFLAHNLGFAHQAGEIAKLCAEHGKFYIEDNCDAFGTTVNGKPTGSFGDLSTISFFPAHHITTGEGGSVCTNNAHLYRLLQQYANWGRDCWCEPGKDNTCNKRFGHSFPHLPAGYDHKYTFTKIGYNFKITELQAAFGLSQIERLYAFKEQRRANYLMLLDIVKPYGAYLTPYALPEGCSPFGFPLLVSSKPVRDGLVEFLESNNVRTRPLFSGNILRHPMMDGVVWDGSEYSYDRSDIVMNRVFWIGCHPSVMESHLSKFQSLLKEYFQ